MEKSISEILRDRRIEIETKISELQQELAQIVAAVDAIAKVPSNISTTPKQNPTIKEMVLGILHAYPEGARANEIISGISMIYGAEVARESLSPQLSRLKDDDHKIILIGRKWKLAPEISPPGEQTLEGL